MNPISSRSQTPKLRWQEPQLLSQQWPGERAARAVVTRGGGSSLAPPPIRGQGCRLPCESRPGGGRGTHAARIPCERRPPPPTQSQPSASRCGQTGEGEGCPDGARERPGPRALGPRGRGSVRKGQAPEYHLPVPRPRRALSGPLFPSAPGQ